MLCQRWVNWDEVTACHAGLDTIPEDLQSSLLDSASELLYLLSGRYYGGLCETTKAVCADCSCLQARCRCTPWATVELRPRPVQAVSRVVVAGVELDPSVYRLRAHRFLDRLDGKGWPYGNPLDDEAFTVTFTYGRCPGAAARRAAAELVAEMAAGCTGGECNLPDNLRSAQTEGGTYEFDLEGLVREGLTGVKAADDWLRAFRHARKAPSAITDPLACSTTLRTV
jgi:hypothetical protein